MAIFLRSECKDVLIRAYHGKMSAGERSEAHQDFLSGRAKVIVATVAFGMGIDKPDIRCVLHYGAPKTMEEYYQQVGRAGRDGLASQCVMFASDNDFSRYQSGFYTDRLTEQAKKVQLESTNYLRKLATDSGKCRRRGILEWFKEIPPWKWCGTCDVCVANATHGDDLERDFRKEAGLLLGAMECSRGSAKTRLQETLQGKLKWCRGAQLTKMERLVASRDLLPVKRRSLVFLFGLLPSLINAGYAKRRKVTGQQKGSYTASWEVYDLTPEGFAALERPDIPILLPVPVSIRKLEAAEAKKTEQRKKELAAAGVDLASIPKQELEDGVGPILQAQQQWIRSVAYYRDKGDSKTANSLEQLLERILEWRDQTAISLKMAPGAVLPDHLARKIAYTKASNPEALRAAGVRIRGVEKLAQLVSSAVEELGLSQPKRRLSMGVGAGGEAGGEAPVLVFPRGSWTPAKKWEHAIYKPRGKLKQMSWEPSTVKFAQGMPLEAIAMSGGAGGKAIMVNTVAGHLLTSLTYGRALDLRRLHAEYDLPTPTKTEWERLDREAACAGLDVVRDKVFQAKDLVRLMLGDQGDIVDKEYATVTPEEKDLKTLWYAKIRNWSLLKRAGLPLQWSSENNKRQKS